MVKFQDFSAKSDLPIIMGIVNLTTDSFSGDGSKADVTIGIDRAIKHMEAGAGIVDIGAESTRPGATPIPANEELSRLIPVVKELVSLGVPVSVDTYKPEVMRQVLDYGASLINDVSGHCYEETLDLIKSYHAGLCVMHAKGEPATMQLNPNYDDVVDDVESFFIGCKQRCAEKGIVSSNLLFDPGFGFGKTVDHNISLFKALQNWSVTYPLLIGVSRKSMLGAITGRDIGERDAATTCCTLLAAQKGVRFVRVHDVAASVDAVKIYSFLG